MDYNEIRSKADFLAGCGQDISGLAEELTSDKYDKKYDEKKEILKDAMEDAQMTMRELEDLMGL